MAIVTRAGEQWLWFVELHPWDDDAAATTAIYLATRSHAFPPEDADAPNRAYDGILGEALSRQASVAIDGDGAAAIGGDALPSWGAITVAIGTAFRASGRLIAWRRYGWDGRRARAGRARVLPGQRVEDLAWADIEWLFDGVSLSMTQSGPSEISIEIADNQAALDQPIETVVYAGTGGVEGGADLKDRAKPFLSGIRRGIVPVASDEANLWFDISPVDGLHSMLDAWDGFVDLSASVSNPPPSGSYYLDAANGRIRLGQKPVYGLVVSARGAFASNATTAAGQIEAMLVDRLGFDAGGLDAAAFAAFDVARPDDVGFYAREGVTGREYVAALVGSALGFVTATRAGKIALKPVAPPTATAETDAQIVAVIEDCDIEIGGVEIAPVASPPWRHELGWRPNDAPADDNAIAGAATAADRAFARQAERIAAVERAATRTKHLLSKPARASTSLDDAGAADGQAALRDALFAVDRLQASFPLIVTPFTLELGDEVWVRSTMFALDQPFVVASLGERSTGPRVALGLWGDLA